MQKTRLSQHIKILKQENLYKGFHTLDRYTLQIPLHQGGMSEPFTREVLDRHDAIVVLPYDPAKNCFVMIEQFRVIPFISGDHPWPLEIPAGLADHEGEKITALIKRELREETGCRAKKLKHLYTYFPDVGGVKQIIHLYVALVDSNHGQKFAGVKTEHEDILVKCVSTAKALELLYRGKINNSVTLIALQWFAIHGEKLREEWLKKK